MLCSSFRYSRCRLRLLAAIGTTPIVASSLAFVSALAAPGLLQAQESADAQPELITVVARKRGQAVQKVDISMDVVDADTLHGLQLNTLPELANLSENVILFEDMPGAGVPAWVIRGVGLQDFNVNNTPTASVYVDGAYQVSTAMGTAGLFDVEQVEILKGPQGGLYGRNTSGGAVLLNSNRANTSDFSGSAEAGYGRWNRSTLSGAVNMPVTDQLAWRVAGRSETSADGWQQSLANGDSHGDSHGEKDRWDLRSWLLFQPTPDLSIQFKLQGGRDDSDIVLGRAVGLYSPVSPPAFCPQALSGNRDISCLTWAGATQKLTQGKAREQSANQSVDGRRVLSDPLNTQSSDYAGSLLELQWDLAAVQLLSLSTWDKYDYGVNLDVDASTGEFAHRLSSSDIEVFSQEFRLVSTAASPLHWLAGVNWSSESLSERRDFLLRDNVLVGLGAGKLAYEQDTDAVSVYGDTSYELARHWQLNGTLRYTNEDKDYHHGSFYIPSARPFYFVRDIAASYELESNWSGSVALNWLPDANSLWYVKYSEGFKSGGFYGGFPFSAVEITPYDAETISAVEVGMKHQWPQQDLQLSTAVFTYDYKDVQGFLRKQNPLTGTAIDLLGNQGDARHLGVEADLDWQFLSQWNLAFGLGWLDAEYRKSGIFTVGTDKSLVEIQGQRPYAPRWSGNLLLGTRQTLGHELQLDLLLGWNYRSEFSGHQYSLLDQAINSLPGYALLTASAELSNAAQDWSLLFWAKNLADKVYKTRNKTDGLNSYMEIYGEPRSIGLSLSHQF